LNNEFSTIGYWYKQKFTMYNNLIYPIRL
jgi:hypothetical protein